MEWAGCPGKTNGTGGHGREELWGQSASRRRRPTEHGKGNLEKTTSGGLLSLLRALPQASPPASLATVTVRPAWGGGRAPPIARSSDGDRNRPRQAPILAKAKPWGVDGD